MEGCRARTDRPARRAETAWLHRPGAVRAEGRRCEPGAGAAPARQRVVPIRGAEQRQSDPDVRRCAAPRAEWRAIDIGHDAAQHAQILIERAEPQHVRFGSARGKVEHAGQLAAFGERALSPRADAEAPLIAGHIQRPGFVRAKRHARRVAVREERKPQRRRVQTVAQAKAEQLLLAGLHGSGEHGENIQLIRRRRDVAQRGGDRPDRATDVFGPERVEGREIAGLLHPADQFGRAALDACRAGRIDCVEQRLSGRRRGGQDARQNHGPDLVS